MVTTERPQPAGAAVHIPATAAPSAPLLRCRPAAARRRRRGQHDLRRGPCRPVRTRWRAPGRPGRTPRTARTGPARGNGPPCESTRACSSSTSRRPKQPAGDRRQRQHRRPAPPVARSSSSGTASSRVKAPTAVRRSAIEVTADTERAHRGRGRWPARTYRTSSVDVHIDVDGVRAVAARRAPRAGEIVTRRGGSATVLALAHPRVRAHALDLDRAHRARHLVDLADGTAPAPPGSSASAVTAAAGVVPVTSPSASSVTVDSPSRIVAEVGLVVPDRRRSAAGSPARRPTTSTPVAIGSSVPRVPDPPGAGQPTDPGDDVVRRHPARLVDHDQPVQPVTRPPQRDRPWSLSVRSLSDAQGGIDGDPSRAFIGCGLPHRAGHRPARPRTRASRPTSRTTTNTRQAGPDAAEAEVERA